MIRITYEIEQIDAGWAVWRSANGGPQQHVPYVGPRPHPDRRSAEQTVENQRRADRAAATRLGVDLA